VCEVAMFVLQSKHGEGKKDWAPIHDGVQNIGVIYLLSFLSIYQSLGGNYVGRQ